MSRERCILLGASYRNICEDYLGVPPIRAVDDVTIKMSGRLADADKFLYVLVCKQGGTASFSSRAVRDYSPGFLLLRLAANVYIVYIYRMGNTCNGRRTIAKNNNQQKGGL